MGAVERASFVVLFAGLVGFVLGAAALGYGALVLGFSLLAHAPGGIHSDWTYLVFLGTLVCLGLGGVAGGRGAAHLAKSWGGQTRNHSD